MDEFNILNDELIKIKNEKIKTDIWQLHDHLQGTKKLSNASLIAINILESLFKIEYSGQVMIPLDFIKDYPNISKIIFSSLFNIGELYEIKEVAELTGFSVQYIWKEIQNGNINAIRKGGIWLFTQVSINDYLVKKGIAIKGD